MQALFFKIPNIIWNVCNEASGTQIEKMVSAMTESTFKPQAERDNVFQNVAEFLERWLRISRKPFMKDTTGKKSEKVTYIDMYLSNQLSRLVMI